MELRIGFDFDNTLASYDKAFVTEAEALGYIEPGVFHNKHTLRNFLFTLPGGHLKWQRLQGYIYGRGMAKATLFDGVADFLQACRQYQSTIYIVSHRTHFGHHDESKTNLHHAARDWMEKNNFFSSHGLGFLPNQVFFEITREEKIKRISSLGCTHFIDDLPEVLTDPAFPAFTKKYLFTPEKNNDPSYNFPIFHHWADMRKEFFEV